jgi:ribokinase
MFIRMPALPGRGETVAGGEPEWFPGGKGANQAVAAARMGGRVSMHAAVGNDEPGRMALVNLEAAGVDLRSVAHVEVSTSIALVMVEESGENQIVIAKGANDAVVVDTGAVGEANAVVMQNEIPLSAMLEAAASCNGTLIVNAAPVREMPDELLSRIDVLIVNEHEFESYGKPTRGVVVVTAGSGEVVAYQDGEIAARATPPVVDAIDTVGAGDTFVGAFAVGITSGLSLQDSLERAVYAASLSTLAHGAQSGMPTAQEVDDFIASKGK